ncbi:membrane protein FAM174A [Lycorma delicatula]|uniref:membrane protein FAM174A n=1 Tax=Lycorma delicatula TaxID=130591 RepID=UPI003F50E6E8
MPDLKMFLNFYIQLFLLLIFSSYVCDSQKDTSNSDDLNRTRRKENVYVENKSNKNVELPKMSTVLNSSVNENDLKNSIPVWSSKVNSTTVMEGFFIFAGLSVAVVLYFTVKAIRLRRRRCRVRKYGLLTNREDVEMTPLGEEEDDEDSTVFDINDHPHSSSRP